MEDLTGKVFGRLTVLKFAKKCPKINKNFWLCKCTCGGTIMTQSNSLKSGNTKSCGCLKNIATYWTGYGEISGGYWRTVEHCAALRKILFDVKIEEVWELFLTQGRRCAISGVELDFTRDYNKKKEMQTASLDRIDCKVHYILSNVQWVHKTVNMMKNTLQDCELVDWCFKIHKFQTEPHKFCPVKKMYSSGDKVIHNNGEVYYFGYTDRDNRAVVYSDTEYTRDKAFVFSLNELNVL